MGHLGGLPESQLRRGRHLFRTLGWLLSFLSLSSPSLRLMTPCDTLDTLPFVTMTGYLEAAFWQIPVANCLFCFSLGRLRICFSMIGLGALSLSPAFLLSLPSLWRTFVLD